jgi:hypothetical protein
MEAAVLARMRSPVRFRSKNCRIAGNFLDLCGTAARLLCCLRLCGGEGGILLPPLPATAGETYTSVIIACVGAGYKRIATSVPVSIVSPIGCISHKNGITGISNLLVLCYTGLDLGMVQVVMASSADCVGSSFLADAIVSKNAA